MDSHDTRSFPFSRIRNAYLEVTRDGTPGILKQGRIVIPLETFPVDIFYQ